MSDTMTPSDIARARSDFLAIMRRRYACKLFDADRALDPADVDCILECARLSPSSFGLEHWHLWAISNAERRAGLKAACFGQDAVGTAALIVVAVCRRDPAYRPDSPFIAERGSRFPGGLSVFVDDYRGYYDYLAANGLVDHWARAQCYIACANMMTGAAACRVDSCAIEGFDDRLVLAELGLDPAQWETGIVTVFGYPAAEANREKIRMPAAEIITYVG